MIDGVTLCMNGKTSFSTVALLSTLWEKEHRDYLDIIGQFVLRCAPQMINARVDTSVIIAKMRAEYGFADIPPQVIEKVLRRLSRMDAQPKRYFYRKNHCYYVLDLFDSCSFDSAQQETNVLIDDVLQALIVYFENHYLHKHISTDKATEYLLRFFDIYGITIIHDKSRLHAITTSNGDTNFYVARFVLDNYEKRTPVFDKLLKIITGFLIYKAVYFYSAEMKTSVDSKLRDVTFYLDCSLVFDALGYDSESDKSAYEEMSQLIRESGGKISIFRHTIEEASRVLEAYARNPQSHNSFALAGLDARCYPADVLTIIARPQSIEENLRKKGVFVCDLPSYEPTHVAGRQYHHDNFVNETTIEQWLCKYSHPENKGFHADRFHYDAMTLSAIGRLRQNKHASSIETCHAIVITQDSMLRRCMRDLYSARFPGEIDFVISDLDLVSLLWLGQRNQKSQLPQNLLIANAVAACHVTQEMMDRAVELACQMEKDGIIPSEAALIIRSQAAIRPILFDETRNDPSRLNEDTIKRAVSEFVVHESHDRIKDAVGKAIDENAAVLHAQHTQDMARVQNELDKVNAAKKQQIDSICADAKLIAEKWARRAENVIQCVGLLIFVSCFGGSAYCWWKDGFVSSNFPAIILSILSLLQIFDYLGKIINLKNHLSVLTHDTVFARIYTLEIRKREKIAHIHFDS